MLSRYYFNLRVHSDFKNSVNPPRVLVMVNAHQTSSAMEMAMNLFRSRAGIPAGADIRVVAQGNLGPSPADDRKKVCSIEYLSWSGDLIKTEQL